MNRPPDDRFSAPVRARIELTASCPDCHAIPKVVDAGTVFDRDGARVQVMHEGSLVLADGYCGPWMTELIRRLRGHHEPQEELVFHHLLRHARPGARIVELGAWWAYYTNWWLGAVPGSTAACVEPDPANAAVGRTNLAINGRTAHWIEAALGGAYGPRIEFQRPGPGGPVMLECLDMPTLNMRLDGGTIEMLHLDMQGAELPFLRSLRRTAQRPRFVMVSTHHESISGSATTHEDCVEELRSQGAAILAEHDVQESYSGDGLVAASFHPADAAISLPRPSRLRGVNPLWAPPEDRAVPPVGGGWLGRTLGRAAAVWARRRPAGRARSLP